MTAYSLLRIAHSYWRWAVLVLAIVAFVRVVRGFAGRRDWSRADERSMRAFLGALDLQMLIGIVLYFLSPFWLATYHSFRETMASPTARFFGVEHQAAMLLAIVAAHAGRDSAKKLTGVHKHRRILVAMVIFFALLLWAIPWPWRVFGRPLFRLEP